MKKISLALVSVLVLAASPVRAQQAEVMAAVTRFVDGFNKGDTRALSAACASETSIIDEFPPHEWHGTGACRAWARDYNANAKKQGITDGVVTLSKPSHLDVTGDRAYVVVPSNYTWKEKGKPMKEEGSSFTFALQKLGPSWRLIGWSWGAK
jgi:hypothetical protein